MGLKDQADIMLRKGFHGDITDFFDTGFSYEWAIWKIIDIKENLKWKGIG